jgi:DNA-binding NarL/FixJ family response regulator
MSTVRTHVNAVYEKLHVHSRTEAAMKLAGRKKTH